MTDVLLLHGLTYDHRTWGPLRDALRGDCRVLAPDLPGHGADGTRRDSYTIEEIVGIIHDQVVTAGLAEPVVVGHSLGAVVATAYAGAHPATAVLNIDQPLLLGPFGDLVRAAEPILRSPDWRQFWDRMLAGMGIDALPDDARVLVETATTPRADLLLGYWSDILRHTDAEIAAQRTAELTAITRRGTGYHWITGSEPPAAYAAWLRERVPGAGITVIPGGHFPHLAHPHEVARILADLRR
ncbi:alpha/beta fold hydrolase [Catenuloplanes japonicus]|uniref:alpha/beta fold hydrolase n=1 Tax=Catenuloplanes japonicus TaxID=33876 RepID=UPI00068FD86B|nr:alpha/beta fold hydrolase [Catenuloplanes japonicus]